MRGDDSEHLLSGLPETRDELLTHARNLKNAGRAGEAIRLLEKACLRSPSPALRKAVAALYKETGRLDDCIAILRDILTRRPDDVPSWLLLADAQVESGKLEAADESRARLAELRASKSAMLRLNAMLDRARKRSGTKSLEEMSDAVTELVDVDSFNDVVFASFFAGPDDETAMLDPEHLPPPSGPQTTEENYYVGPTRVDEPLDEHDSETEYKIPAPLEARAREDRAEGDELFEIPSQDSLAWDESETTSDTEIDLIPEQTGPEAQLGLDDSSADDGPSPKDTFLGRPGLSAQVSETTQPGPPGSADDDTRSEGAGAAVPSGMTESSDAVSTQEWSRDTGGEGAESETSGEDTEVSPPVDSGVDGFGSSPPRTLFEISEAAEEPPEDPGFSVPPAEEPPEDPNASASVDGLPPEDPGFGSAEVEGPPEDPGFSVPDDEEAPEDPGFDAAASRGDSPIEEVASATPSRSDVGTLAAPSSSLLMKVAIAIGVLAILVVASGAAVVYSLESALESKLADAQEQQRTDTYQGYKDAASTLATIPEVASFAGPDVDAFLADMGLRTDAIETSRTSAVVELALVNAMIEYRYEKMDSRESETFIEDAATQVDGDPRVEAARAFRLMAGGHQDEAGSLLDKARLDHSRSREVAIASIELALDENRPKAADHLASLLRDTSRKRVYYDYLLGRVALAKDDPAARGIFTEILEESSPQHLSARIQQSYALRLGAAEGAASDGARELVEPILGELSEAASPYQEALAHVAMGDIEMADGAVEEANAHFEKAVEISPSRPLLHIRLVDFYMETGQAEEAFSHMTSALEQIGKTDALLFRKAQALAELGRCEQVLSTVGEMSSASYRSAFLAGQCHLQLGSPIAAQEAFETAIELDEGRPLHAKALEIVAEVRAAKTLDDGRIPVMNSLVEESSGHAVVKRAQGLMLLEFAEAETGYREQREILAEAIEALTDATKARPDWAPAAYELCRAHMRLGQGEPAAEHCERGRTLDRRYRPGMITSIRLELRSGRHEAAAEQVAQLVEEFPDAPDVAFARIESLVAANDVVAAREEWARWADKDAASSYEAQIALARLAFELGDYREARSAFEAALEQRPRSVEAAVYAEWAGIRSGEQTGEETLKNRLSDPLWGPRAWQALGELRLLQDDLSGARENFAEALEKYRETIAPLWRHSESYAGLARTWARIKGWDHYVTRRFVSRAESRGDASSVPAQFINGVYDISKRRSSSDEAAEHFEKVIALEPYRCEAVEYLIDIYDGRGEDFERVSTLRDEYCVKDEASGEPDAE